MRSSSIKTLVSAVSILACLTLSVPTAQARPAQSAPASAQRDEPRFADRAARIVRRVVTRLAGITTNNWPTVPIPDPTTNPNP